MWKRLLPYLIANSVIAGAVAGILLVIGATHHGWWALLGFVGVITLLTIMDYRDVYKTPSERPQNRL
jgi:amino acid transporter